MMRTKVFYQGRYVTAFNDCQWRPYIYPLCTPAGACMIQEATVDHPFHNGIFFAHDSVDGVNFWVPAYSPLATFCSGRVICRQRNWELVAEDQIQFQELCEWIDPMAAAVLKQTSTYDIQCRPTVNSIRIKTSLDACRALTLKQTKEALLGIRIADNFCVHNGGRMIDAEGRINEQGIMDQTGAWVDCQGRVGDMTAGILITQPANRRPIAWFARDYGLIGINQFRTEGDLPLQPGKPYELDVLIAAHDGDHTNPELMEMVNK